MANEEKTHTKGEVDILIALARVETLQCVMNDDLNDHKEKNEHTKTEILQIARKEFTPIIDFTVFKTELKSSIRSGVVVSSILTPVVISLIYIVYQSVVKV